MRRLAIIAMLFMAPCASRADIIYLNRGEAISGKITDMDSTSLKLTLADGRQIEFAKSEVFQATDDGGRILYPALSGQLEKNPIFEPENTVGTQDKTSFPFTEGEYRRVYRFQFWPLLGGTAILGYVGFTQLQQSSDTYAESQDLEAAGMEFNSLRDRSQKQRTWGEISLAGAAACLIVGLTPRIEKVPVVHALKVLPAKNGIRLCLTF